jgi:hypothetical protein
MTTCPAAIDDFWVSFQEDKDALAKISTADHPAYDAVLRKLQQLDSGLYFEFSPSSESNELVITADGDAELFDLVEEIVACAPRLDGWRVFALKRKQGFPETVTWQGFNISMSEVVFDPLNREGSRDLGLCIYVQGLARDDVDYAHSAILRAIDFGLGERSFAENVQYVEVRPLPVGSRLEDFIPLADLEKYIDWRSRNETADQ